MENAPQRIGFPAKNKRRLLRVLSNLAFDHVFEYG
jgi:hypothetical protein